MGPFLSLLLSGEGKSQRQLQVCVQSECWQQAATKPQSATSVPGLMDQILTALLSGRWPWIWLILREQMKKRKSMSEVFSLGPAAESPPALSLNVPLLLTLIPCCLFLPFSVALRSFLCHRDVSCHRCYRSTVERCDYPRRCLSNRLAHSLAVRCDVPVVTLPPSRIKRQFQPFLTLTHYRKHSGLNKKSC